MSTPTLQDLKDLKEKFLDAHYAYWLTHSFLSWQWWAIFFTTILFWLSWWKLVDRKRIHLILNFGLIIGVIAAALDMLGSNYGAWGYLVRLYWAFIPPLLPFDLTYIPVTYMLLYQHFGNSWTRSIIAFSIASAIYSFLAEPLLMWSGIYVIYQWKLIYSFFIYVLLACLVKFLVDLLTKKQSIKFES